MITVRFQNGQAVTYNSADTLLADPHYGWKLLTKGDGDLVACIQPSAGVIVEFEPPCKVENPLAEVNTRTVTLTTAEYQRLFRRARKQR